MPKNIFTSAGPNYDGRLGEFGIKYWSVSRAVKRSDSLKRAMQQLANFHEVYTP